MRMSNFVEGRYQQFVVICLFVYKGEADSNCCRSVIIDTACFGPIVSNSLCYNVQVEGCQNLRYLVQTQITYEC